MALFIKTQPSLFTLIFTSLMFTGSPVAFAADTEPFLATAVSPLLASPMLLKPLFEAPLATISKIRLDHAKELLGKRFAKKVTKQDEAETDVADFVKETTRKFLGKKHRKNSGKIAKAILEAAEDFELDPLFLMAVIQNESSFDPTKKGSIGEIGLMQIRPTTAAWISKLYKLKYKNSKSLYDPVTNIYLGAALMDKLRDQFDSHSRLYLSAYNIGATKVRSMVTDNKSPKDYVQAVMKRYMALYTGFRFDGDPKEQSEMAWAKTMSLTQKSNKKIN